MTKNLVLLSLPALLVLLACGNDPARESGQPDDRAEPKTEAEATAQDVDRRERQAALREKGLCTPEAIRKAPEPDERFWHCRGEDWTGTTQIKDKLAELLNDPQAYRDFCSKTLLDGLGIQRVLCDGVEH
jgi:hypothetical protein